MVFEVNLSTIEVLEQVNATPSSDACFTEPNEELSMEHLSTPSEQDYLYESDDSATVPTWPEEESVTKTNFVMTCEELKALDCRGMLVKNIEIRRVDFLANECYCQNIFNPFTTPRLHLITTQDHPTCAIVVKGNHRVAAVAKQGLTSDERIVKVFGVATTVSATLFNSIWKQAHSLRYSDLDGSFNKATCPPLVMEIHCAAEAERVADQNADLNEHMDYYMWTFSHIYSEAERLKLADDRVQRNAESIKWFGCGPSKRQRMRIQLLDYFCARKEKKSLKIAKKFNAAKRFK